MTNNTLAFIALSNEYCSALEHAAASEPRELTATLLGLLPRIYISGRDLSPQGMTDDGYIDSALDEDSYDSVRRTLEAVFGEDDVYLETFESDMKYSDTPIGASVAEGLADLFQELYNFLEAVRDAPEDLVESAVAAVKENFEMYWSQTLCNLLRPLNAIYYK